MYALIFHPEADKEFAESVIWYEEQKEKLGERFSNAIEEIIERIQTHPESFGYSKRPFREASVKTFPFTIIYKVNKTKQLISIVSIYHAKRNPKKKYRRISR